MRQLMCQRYGIVAACQGLIRIPQDPEGPSGIDATGNARIMANTEHRRAVLVWRVECDPFLQVLEGSRQLTKVEPRRPEGMVGDDSECRVVGALCQVEQGFPELACRI